MLLLLVVTAGLAAEITPDGDPTAGPGKVTTTGKWKLAEGEKFGFIEILAIPTGGGGGKGGFVVASKGTDTYTGTVENLAPNTEYDVIIHFSYTANNKQSSVYSKTYKVKTKDTTE